MKVCKRVNTEKILLLAVMLLPTLAISVNLDNDFWFLLNHGEYIIQHGFPTIEPFTIHQELNFVIQQWLFDVLITFVYRILGKTGVLLLVYASAIITLLLIYKLCMLLCEQKRYLSVIITTVCYLLLCVWFFVSRPQIMTYMILLAELLCLETYVRNRKLKCLLLLPLLSLMLINFHASMWWLLFAFLAPYLVETFRIDKLSLNSDPLPKPALYVTTCCMLVMGFVNPYGYRAIFYIVGSFGDDTINSSIQEMAAPDVKSLCGAVFFVLILTMVLCYVMNSKGKTRLRYILLTLGTTLLALMSIKSIPYFLFASIIPLSYHLKNVAHKLYFDHGKTKLLTKITALFLVLIFGCSIYVIVKDYDETADYPQTKAALEYLASHEDTEQVRLYTSFFDGGYAEYCGFQTYIDARAEVFLAATNGKKDIFLEYMQLQRGSLHYKEFLSRYNFTHFLVTPSDTLEIYLSRDEVFDVYYEDENCKIYILPTS